MKKQYFWFIILIFLFVGCVKELDQMPESTTSESAVFGSQDGLNLYTNSFYTMLTGQATNLDAMSDYLAVKSVSTFIQKDAFAPTLSSGWSWTDLRNINYFINSNNDPIVPADVRRNYTGIAKFFRAYFYFEKVLILFYMDHAIYGYW
jgi:hypothetical protein